MIESLKAFSSLLTEMKCLCFNMFKEPYEYLASKLKKPPNDSFVIAAVSWLAIVSVFALVILCCSGGSASSSLELLAWRHLLLSINTRFWREIRSLRIPSLLQRTWTLIVKHSSSTIQQSSPFVTTNHSLLEILFQATASFKLRILQGFQCMAIYL